MTEPTQDTQSSLQRHILQMARELACQLEKTANDAPAGGIVGACEDLMLDRGRQFLRDCLASTLQHQIDEAEKKKALRVPALVDTLPAAIRGSVAANS